MKKRETLTPNEAVEAVERWLSVLHSEEHDPPRPPDPSHSSLLWWLLHGNEPLPHPPPVFYSRPDHGVELGEERRVRLMEIEHEGMREIVGSVAVNQGTQWEVVERDGDTWTLRWPPSGTLYRLTPDASEPHFYTHRMVRLATPTDSDPMT